MPRPSRTRDGSGRSRPGSRAYFPEIELGELAGAVLSALVCAHRGRKSGRTSRRYASRMVWQPALSLFGDELADACAGPGAGRHAAGGGPGARRPVQPVRSPISWLRSTGRSFGPCCWSSLLPCSLLYSFGYGGAPGRDASRGRAGGDRARLFLLRVGPKSPQQHSLDRGVPINSGYSHV